MSRSIAPPPLLLEVPLAPPAAPLKTAGATVTSADPVCVFTAIDTAVTVTARDAASVAGGV